LIKVIYPYLLLADYKAQPFSDSQKKAGFSPIEAALTSIF
jgi:hypothetical protein